MSPVEGGADHLSPEQQRRVRLVTVRHAWYRLEHHLPSTSPQLYQKLVAQKRPNFALEQVAIIEAEIDKLIVAGFIEEVSYLEWLANIVLVAKQENGKWRVCVNYTDLNKACPKHNFPLLGIDQLVDSTSDNQLLSFMDAYSSYNQILMHQDDKMKTSFIIERGTYYYKVVLFGLKNVRATYQRLVNKMLKEQIGKTMEVYVTTCCSKPQNMHITSKTRPVLHEVESKQMHETYLTSPPLLSKPVPGEDLFVYLAVSNSDVSSALIREELGPKHSVFYTSKALLDVETRYPKLENLILALVVLPRKLRPYYQAHQVIIMTNFPLRSILHSPNASQ
ncbi:hypothetical protein L3X38_026868 [Prunus dulcis]|uniref:Reverse transcriptase/retrotransposon-derived protein RNase H-like domain-containing protein n=1 Tax=Prunus dulcis TaxID=3755 RepID=A0AAD4YYX3_PRUDU|nr:hypothetical protein L3X38_026868 [Prunus dulcis]